MPRYAGTEGLRKVRLSTTILTDSSNVLDELIASEEIGPVRTPGEAIDYLCTTFARLSPRVRQMIREDCRSHVSDLKTELGRVIVTEGSNSLSAAAVRIDIRSLERIDTFVSRGLPEAQFGAPMQRINMSSGDYVVFPKEGWHVLNPKDAKGCAYCVAIEIRGGQKYNAPHFLLFRKTRNDLTEEEEGRVRNRIRELWSDFEKVERDEVPLAFDGAGAPTNKEEHLSGPIVGFFNVLDDRELADSGMEPPQGVEIVRSRG